MVGQGCLDFGMDEVVLLSVVGQDVQFCFDLIWFVVQWMDVEVVDEIGCGEVLFDQFLVVWMCLYCDVFQVRCGVV